MFAEVGPSRPGWGGIMEKVLLLHRPSRSAVSGRRLCPCELAFCLCMCVCVCLSVCVRPWHDYVSASHDIWDAWGITAVYSFFFFPFFSSFFSLLLLLSWLSWSQRTSSQISFFHRRKDVFRSVVWFCVISNDYMLVVESHCAVCHYGRTLLPLQEKTQKKQRSLSCYNLKLHFYKTHVTTKK